MQILNTATYKAINVTINYRLPEFETATLHQQKHSCGLIRHTKEHSRAQRKMEETPSSPKCFEINLCISVLSNVPRLVVSNLICGDEIRKTARGAGEEMTLF
jgi:hypothetical protein